MSLRDIVPKPVTITSPQFGEVFTDPHVTLSGTAPAGFPLSIQLGRLDSDSLTAAEDGSWTYTLELTEGDHFVHVSYWWGIEGGEMLKVEDWIVLTYEPLATPDPRGRWTADICSALHLLNRALDDYGTAWIWLLDTDPDAAVDLTDSILENLDEAERLIESVPPWAGGDDLSRSATSFIVALRSGAEAVNNGQDPGVDLWTRVLSLYHDDLVWAADRVFEPGFGCKISQVL